MITHGLKRPGLNCPGQKRPRTESVPGLNRPGTETRLFQPGTFQSGLNHPGLRKQTSEK